jgi:hypothetical protein
MQVLFAGILILLFGAIMMFSSNLFQVLLGFIFSLLAYYSFARMSNRGKILDEVNKRKKLAHPDVDFN